MNKYSISIFVNIQANRTEAEICFNENASSVEAFVGIVYEHEGGWIVEHENKQIPLPEKEVDNAKLKLNEYVNRKGIIVSPEMSAAGHSLLLM